MWKVILTANPLKFNLESLLKYFQMSFVYESLYAVCNGRVRVGSTWLFWWYRKKKKAGGLYCWVMNPIFVKVCKTL